MRWILFWHHFIEILFLKCFIIKNWGESHLPSSPKYTDLLQFCMAQGLYVFSHSDYFGKQKTQKVWEDMFLMSCLPASTFSLLRPLLGTQNISHWEFRRSFSILCQNYIVLSLPSQVVSVPVSLFVQRWQFYALQPLGILWSRQPSITTFLYSWNA